VGFGCPKPSSDLRAFRAEVVSYLILSSTDMMSEVTRHDLIRPVSHYLVRRTWIPSYTAFISSHHLSLLRGSLFIPFTHVGDATRFSQSQPRRTLSSISAIRVDISFLQQNLYPQMLIFSFEANPNVNTQLMVERPASRAT
jgi:hypothetical protein